MADQLSRLTHKLDALTAADCEIARQWRNTDEVRLGFRTPYMLTEEMQASFYRDVVCNRNAPHRYWAVRDEAGAFVALAGLSFIQWENGLAEISLDVDPARRNQGIGADAVELVLREGFKRMRLLRVVGEVYNHNPGRAFWLRMVERFHGQTCFSPRGKFWNGELHDATAFYFEADRWRTE